MQLLQVITPEMEAFMSKLTGEVVVGLVGGSDLVKINEQMNGKALSMFTHVFSENGLVYHRNGEHVATKVGYTRSNELRGSSLQGVRPWLHITLIMVPHGSKYIQCKYCDFC